MRHLLIPLLIVEVFLSALTAAPVHWSPPRGILGDSDVSTNGILVRALAKAGAASPTVNGVTFGPFPGPDTLSDSNASNFATGALQAGGSISGAYATMLSQNDFRTNSGTGAGTTMNLTLNNLLAGHHYELQIWFHDSNTNGLGTLRVKSSPSLDPWVTLAANPAKTAGGRGQHAIGTFTADSATQVIQLTGNPVVALQAYQLRRITAPLAPVVWESWREITGPADVATTGAANRAYAFGPTAPAAPVNGVSFTRFVDQSGDSVSGFANVGGDCGSASQPFAGLPDDYRTLLGGAAVGGRAGTLTLNNLQPGQWYLVQVWANDSRASAGGRTQRINGSLFLNTNPGGASDNLNHEGGLGQWMQGTFQANNASQRLDFVSGTSIQLNAMQVRSIPEPDPHVQALRWRRHFTFHSFLDGHMTSSAPWVAVQAHFATGDLSRARAELSKQAAIAASTNLVPTSSFDLWPAMDLFMRRRPYIDALSKQRFIATLRKFDYRNWSNTSNLSKLSWTIRTLGSQEFGETSFIFPANAWRDADPRGYGPLTARLEQEARQGTGEYASAPYGWYNIMPTLSLAQLCDDANLRDRAKAAFDAHLAQLAANWMPGGYLATWSGRSYPLSGSPMSLGRNLWFWFGDGMRAGEAKETIMAAVMDHVPPVPVLRAAAERTGVHTIRHRADAFQTAYIHKDQFGFFSHDGSGGGDQQYPDGLRWRGMPGNYLYVTRPAVDSPSVVRASNAPGNANADYSTLQHHDVQLMAFDLSYRSIPIPYAIGYVPGNYSAMINRTGNSTPADGRPRVFLNYDRVMVAITADVPFTWDPNSGIYCPWPNVRTGDSEFRIAVGGVGSPVSDPDGFTANVDHANNRFAVAIEVAHPEEFPGNTAAERLAAFQASILANTSLTRDPATRPTTARYTTRRGDRLRVTSKSNTGIKTAYINDQPLMYDNSWPMISNPWISQPQRGANITMSGGGVQTLIDLANWSRTDSSIPVTDPLPGIAANPASGITSTAATAVGTLVHPGAPPAVVTLHWGTSDAGNADPGAWPHTVDLGSPAGGQLFASIAGLSPDTGYVYRFRASNAAGAVWSPAVAFRTRAIAPPGVPGNLRFSPSLTGIPLEWDAVAEATSYLIRRSTTSGGPYSEIATGINGTAFTDNTAIPGTVYHYVVAAVGPGGSGGNSGQLTAAVTVQPAAPAGLNVTTAYRYAFLTWNPVPWATSYTVKRGTSSTGPFITIATGITGTSYEDITSVHGVRYHYVVSAGNLAGEGANSAVFSHTVSVLAFITDSTGPWSTVPWFPPARGLPVSGASTVIDFDNQAGPISSQQDRGAFTLNQLRFLGKQVSLGGNAITLGGTNPRVTVAASAAGTIANPLTLSAATTFDVAGSLVLDTAFGGSASLTKIGAGTLDLARANPHTGNLVAGGGLLVLSATQQGLASLIYGASAATATPAAVSIQADSNAAGLLVQSTGASNDMFIPPCATFTITGSHTQGGFHNGIAASHLAIRGGGGFRYNNPAGGFIVRRGSTLDLSESGPVTITASRLVLGDLDNSNQTLPSTLVLPGSADTLIRADNIALSATTAGGGGTARGESTSLRASGGTGGITIRNTAGSGPALLDVNRVASSSTITNHLLDFRGQAADLWLSALNLGLGSASTSSTEMFFDTGTLRVDGPTLVAINGSGAGKNTATLDIAGGEVFLTGGLEIARALNGQNAQGDFNLSGGNVVCGPITMVTSNPGYVIGTVNLTGGSLTLTGPITRGPIGGLASGNYNSTGSARLILDGATLDLGGHAIGSSAAPLQSIAINSGVLKNVASINGGAGFTKLSPGTLVIDGVNTWSGPTIVSNDILEVLGSLTSPGTVTIGPGATLSGNGTLRAPVVIGGSVDPASALRLERTVILEATATITLGIDRSTSTTPIIAGSSMLTYGGTLRVLHQGDPLVAGDRFVLFDSAAFGGSFATLDLPVLDAGLAWDTRGLAGDGSITVRDAAELAASLGQTVKFWDLSADPGLQGGAAVWNIGTSPNWSIVADGSPVLERFWQTNTVRFQTGAANDVTLSGQAAVAGLVQSGNGTATTISGGRILINSSAGISNGSPTGNQPLVIHSEVAINGQPSTIHAQQAVTLGQGLSGAGNLTKTGDATLAIAGASPWTGHLLLGGGATRFEGPTGGITALSYGPAAASTPGSSLELTHDLTLPGAAFKLQSLGSNHLALPAGRTLTLTGETVLGLNSATISGPTGNTALSTSGGGSLVIQTAGKNFTVAGSRSFHAAQVDLTGLAGLNLDAGGTGNLFLGVYNSSTNDYLYLPPASTISGNIFYVGDVNPTATVALRLGAGENTFNLNQLYLGQKPGANNRSDGTISFPAGAAAASLRLRANDGAGRSSIFINDNNSTTGRNLSNTFDTTGFAADLLLNQLVISRRNASSSPATVTTDFFRWDRGNLDVQSQVILCQAPANAQKLHIASMTIGSAASSPADTAIFRGGIIVAQNRSTVATAGAQAQGALTIAGGTVSSGEIILGEILTTTAPTGGTRQSHASLTVSGGTLVLSGPVRSGSTAGPGTKTAGLTLNGGSLDLGGNAIGGAGTTALTSLVFQSGTLSNVASINGGSGFTKTGAGILTLAGNHLFTGPVAVSEGTLHLRGGITSGVSVASGATLIHSGSAGGGITLASGAVHAPDATPSASSLGGSYALPAGATLRLRLDSPSAFDSITLTGAASTITLGGTLELVPAPDLPAGTRFRIFRNQGNPASPVANTFDGRPAMQPFVASGRTWYLDYTAGSGGDIDLVLASELELWRISHFGTPHATGPAADLADPDADGLPNLLEYALARDPGANSSTPAIRYRITVDGIEISFLRARSGITYLVEASSDLATWTTIATDPGGVGQEATVTEPLPGTMPRLRFLRLRIVSP